MRPALLVTLSTPSFANTRRSNAGLVIGTTSLESGMAVCEGYRRLHDTQSVSE